MGNLLNPNLWGLHEDLVGHPASELRGSGQKPKRMGTSTGLTTQLRTPISVPHGIHRNFTHHAN